MGRPVVGRRGCVGRKGAVERKEWAEARQFRLEFTGLADGLIVRAQGR